jgi:hypothetical protein
MKFKNLLTGRKFVWEGELFIKLENPPTEPCQWSSTGTRPLNAVQLSGHCMGEIRGFSPKDSDNRFTQVRDQRHYY